MHNAAEGRVSPATLDKDSRADSLHYARFSDSVAASLGRKFKVQVRAEFWPEAGSEGGVLQVALGQILVLMRDLLLRFVTKSKFPCT